MRIVLLGKAGAGKDTVADYLVRHYGFRKYAFADSLKAVARQLWPERFEDCKPRKLLQDIGAKMREIDAAVWINCVFRRIAAEQPGRVVISDCRYPNEYYACVDRYFIPVVVWCRDDIRHRRLFLRDHRALTDDEASHASEQMEPPNGAWVLDNNGTFDDLYRQIDEMMACYEVGVQQDVHR